MTDEPTDKGMEYIDEDASSICRFYSERRKQSICEYIEEGGVVFKENNSLITPQISCNQLENTRHHIDKFYGDKLDFIEYGSSSVNTIHCLYRHTDDIVYVAITKPLTTRVLISDDENERFHEMKCDVTDTRPTKDENGFSYIEVIRMFEASEIFIRNSFYFTSSNITI